MKSTPENTFCAHPFNEVAIKNFSGDKLLAAWPCCMMGNRTTTNHKLNKLGIENVHDLTPAEIFHHPRMQLLRENLKTGVKDIACDVCWQQEDIGMLSFRNATSDVPDEIVDNPELTVMDITGSNQCNLRCRMCSPFASNSLMQDQKFFKENGLFEGYMAASQHWTELPNSFRPTESRQWDWLMANTDKIKTLRASGGEPFYDNKIVTLIDRYIETDSAKNTELHFHTNGTMIDDAMIEKLNKFKINRHTFSVDGYGKIYDYIRYPSSFENMDSILRNYVSKINTYELFNITIVVSSLNLSCIADYIKWIYTIHKNPIFAFAEINPRIRGTHISRLPRDLLETYLKRLDQFSQNDMHINSLRAMINNAIVNNMEDKQRMLAEIIPFDKSRNQSYKDFLDQGLIDWLEND
jgi:MoaA/NifB/PqqE/SkfB family radical SAM enzyme